MNRQLFALFLLGVPALLACEKKSSAPPLVASPKPVVASAVPHGEVVTVVGGDYDPKKNTCEQAFQSMMATVDAIGKSMPKGVPPPPPKNQDFMKGCSELPLEMQRCLVMAYALQHQKECKEVHNRVDPSLQAKVQKLMKGN